MSTIRDMQEYQVAFGENLPELSLEVLQTFDVAVARVKYQSPLNLVEYATVGASKRNKGEVFNTETGRMLAISRALHQLAKELEEDAEVRG